MSREQRRSGRGSARSQAQDRRTPVPAEGGGGGSRIPMVPLLAILGIAAVVGLAGYLIWQAGQPAGESSALQAEADASPDLPGEFINLPELHGDGEGYSATGPHVTQEVDYEADQGLPPTGGPHWGSGACPDNTADAQAFCGPVPAGFYDTDDPWPAGSLIHNMEHGSTVVWYNTEDQEIIDDLADFGGDNSGDSPALVVSFFPEMEAETVAITTWSRRLVMTIAEYDRDALQDFFDVNNCRFDPEDIC